MKLILIFSLIINVVYAGLVNEGLSILKNLSIAGGAGVVIASDSDEHTIENITLQPKWHEQFQFAGYYVAKKQGFYKDVGLNVSIKPYKDDIESISDMVVDEDSNTTYGIGGSSLILDMLEHKKIVLLKALLQESPVVILSLKKNTLNDSKHKRIMIPKNELENVVFQSILNRNSTEIKESLQIIDKMPSIEDLIEEKTDFMIAYKTNEPFVLQAKGYQEKEDYNIYSAEKLGMKFYADILFTSKREVEEHPDRVKRFIKASMEGWRVAFSDINKTAKFIYEHYNEHNKSLEALIFEGNKLREMAIKRDNDFGNISALRLKAMESYYFDRGLVHKNLLLNEYEDYIYKEWYEKNKKKIENIVLSLIIVLVIIFLIFLIFFISI